MKSRLGSEGRQKIVLEVKRLEHSYLFKSGAIRRQFSCLNGYKTFINKLNTKNLKIGKLSDPTKTVFKFLSNGLKKDWKAFLYKLSYHSGVKQVHNTALETVV